MLSISLNASNLPSVKTEISFGLVSAPPNRVLCSSLFTCRDYINDYTQSVVQEMSGQRKVNNNYLANSSTPPDFTRLRLLIGTAASADIKKKIFFAKKIVNILEKEMGFKTSKITSVEIKMEKSCSLEGTQFFLLTGPSEWMYGPQPISFVTFIFKSCFYTDINIIKAHDDIAAVEDVKKYFQAVIKNTENNNYYTNNYTKDFVEIFLKNVDFFIKKFNDIFLPDSLENMFPPKEVCVHSSWGIMNFFQRGETITNKNVSARYITAREEYKKEKE